MATQKKSIDKFLRELKEVPSLPDVVVKILQLMREENTNADELTRAISQDVGITTNVLRLCNSAYYGLPRTISSLTQAIMYLGFHTVRNLVLTCSVSPYYGSTDKIYGYQEGGLWHHSVACAMVSELICEHFNPDMSDTAFTAGLLHDIGQLIIGMQIKDTASTIEELMEEHSIGDIAAEKEVLSISHDLVGALLAYQWDFPTDLTKTIRFHHAPNEGRQPHFLSAVVHVADTIVLKLGYGIELKQLVYPVKPSALEVIGIDKNDINHFGFLSRQRVDERAPQFLRLGSDDSEDEFS